jgi:hypothetical protein
MGRTTIDDCFIDDKEVKTLMSQCRRHGYEIYKNQRAYCNRPDKYKNVRCIYHNEQDNTCGMLDKIYKPK